MVSISIDDSGLKLSGFKGKLKTKAKIALRSGGNVIANKAKEIITEKGLIKTGTMRRSIHSEPIDSFDELSVRVGTSIEDPPYPFYLEFGTKNEDGSTKMSAKPFLRPALDESEKEAIKEVGDVLKILF